MLTLMTSAETTILQFLSLLLLKYRLVDFALIQSGGIFVLSPMLILEEELFSCLFYIHDHTFPVLQHNKHIMIKLLVEDYV